jgi:ribosomal-protein-alanine N-acetyltransferase
MIKTERLELVGFDVKYANDLFELWSDFEVIKYTFTPLITSMDDCKSLIEHQISRTNKNFTDRFVIILNNKAIGIIGCICMDKENLTFGLYYQISRKY